MSDVSVSDEVILGRVVTPTGIVDRGWLAIAEGRIAAIGAGAPPQAAKIHDAGDALVLPGIIDGQTHAGSYGGLPGIESTTRSAVAGGVTTIVDMPYDNPRSAEHAGPARSQGRRHPRHAHANVALYATVMPATT
jgi:allantoinase